MIKIAQVVFTVGVWSWLLVGGVAILISAIREWQSTEERNGFTVGVAALGIVLTVGSLWRIVATLR